MDDIIANVMDIRTWLEHAPEPKTFLSEDSLMKFLVEDVMGRSLYLARISAVMAPSRKVATHGYTKHRAVIAAHLVRMAKLYDGFYQHVARRESELAEIFVRPLQETMIRMRYFLACGCQRRAIRSFILTSYRSERQSIKDLKEKRKKRPLIPIERRMLRSMMRNIREDGITFRELEGNKNWKIDGKDVAAMLRHLGEDWQYSYGFGGSSRFVHGNWMDMKHRHLTRDGARYHPKVEFSDPDIRIAGPVTIEVLEASVAFLRWNRADPDNFVRGIIVQLSKYVRSLDSYHEARFMRR